ncbi:MAG: general secretion pathway protein GspK [Kiritimatiellae bacterium]|nr:general secretion pathway protein GspK [Kiritimatiellia bacterium]
MRPEIGSRKSRLRRGYGGQAADGRQRSGSVLILALWVLFFLAALALAVGAHVSASLKLAGFMKQDVRAYHLARAGVTHAALQVACNTNQWDAWSEGAWNADPGVFIAQVVGDGGTFSIINVHQTPDGSATNVGLVGAESRLNLNRADELIFEQLMIRVGGLGGGQADALHKALQAYRETKQQHLLTIRAARGYVEPDSGGVAPLESVHELLLVEGMDDGVFALIEPYVTVYGSSGKINANTASAELLLSCAEAYTASRERIGEIIAQRESEPLTKTSELSSIAFLAVRSTAFYGTAVGYTASGGEAARIQFVVDKSGQRQYWHEF